MFDGNVFGYQINNVHRLWGRHLLKRDWRGELHKLRGRDLLYDYQRFLFFSLRDMRRSEILFRCIVNVHELRLGALRG